MAYFSSAQEVDCYVGGVLRMAAVHPLVGNRLAAASITLSIRCTDPEAQFTVSMFAPVTVTFDDGRQVPDVELICPGDVLDGFFRGRTSLVEALANGEATARGRVSKVLKVLPVLEWVFPSYRMLVASKDASVGMGVSAAP